MTPNSVPRLGGNGWAYIEEARDTNWVSSAGRFVNDLESQLADTRAWVTPHYGDMGLGLVRKLVLRPHPEGWGMDALAFRRG